MSHFDADDRRHGLFDPSRSKNDLAIIGDVTLATLIDRGARKRIYTDEIAEDCRPRITVETAGPGECGIAYPRFVCGTRCYPYEDISAIDGLEMLFAATAPILKKKINTWADENIH